MNTEKLFDLIAYLKRGNNVQIKEFNFVWIDKEVVRLPKMKVGMLDGLATQVNEEIDGMMIRYYVPAMDLSLSTLLSLLQYVSDEDWEKIHQVSNRGVHS